MLQLRPAVPDDVSLILTYIRELAEYEQEPDAVHITEEILLRDGFGDHPRFGCVMAEWSGKPAGCALYYLNYSTWTGGSGLFLEDLFVRPAFRGHGIGNALLVKLAQIAVEKGYKRLQWDVLHWNAPAISFYEKIGAAMHGQWRIMRVDGANIAKLAASGEDTK